MIDPDLDDTHLCIRCSATIVGLENYIEHRKSRCSGIAANTPTTSNKLAAGSSPTTSHSVVMTPRTASNLEHSYENFAFTNPESETPSSHGGKTSKSLNDSYYLPDELGADVFFSSLQLQSVQSSVSTTGGKTSSHAQHANQLQRQKSNLTQQESSVHAEVAENAWIEAQASGSGQHDGDTLMKAISDINDAKKPYEIQFKSIAFEQESGESSEEEEEDDVEMDDDDDEDYDPMEAEHGSGGKWKPPQLRQSPPVVPVSHTGGKWKPENRPNLRVTHTQLQRFSPNWDEPMEDADAADSEHPPDGHTKGKWVPGTKLQRLEYKEEVVELARSKDQHYWCNICCRKLKSKAIYENHLRTSYHLKRAEPEQQLEKASLDALHRSAISHSFCLTESVGEANKESTVSDGNNKSARKKRHRRATFIKCELCKHVVYRHLIGKHLISHYHYRRLQMNPGKSLHMILDNIHWIVLQSPYQCRPCRFYSNTEETFLQHWNSPSHLNASERPGKFWCSYCRFECEDNNQMRRHLLSSDHKDVILAINRSVPICISKKLNIDCSQCGLSFRYNMELRQHMRVIHPGVECDGTASDSYQSRHVCGLCSENFRSKVALQRHKKHKHRVFKYFCSICSLEFSTSLQARQHRKTLKHRLCSVSLKKKKFPRNRKFQNAQKKAVKNTTEVDFDETIKVEELLNQLSRPEDDCLSTISPVKVEQLKSQDKPKQTVKKSQPGVPNKSKMIKCKDCNEEYETKDELRTHRDVEHPLLKHICITCGQSFALAQELGQHVRTCQPSTSSKAVAELNLTRIANSDAKGKTEFTCDDCKFSAEYKSELIFHRLHHLYGPMGKTQLISCPLCEKVFRKHSLRCHLRQHTNEKVFECEYCGIKFARRHNLKDHVKNLHLKDNETIPKDSSEKKKTEGEYQCDTCGKVFKSKYSLRMHSVKHGSDERKFGCSYEGCNYAAVTKAILRIHFASHGEGKFQCAHDGCSYIGKSQLHLRRHTQTHNAPTKLYSCDRCAFRSRIKGHLTRHMISHSGEKLHQCPYCCYRCSTLDNLRKHVLQTNKHPGRFIYECKLCEAVVRQLKDIRAPAASTDDDVDDDDGKPEIFKSNYQQEYQMHLSTVHEVQAIL